MARNSTAILSPKLTSNRDHIACFLNHLISGEETMCDHVISSGLDRITMIVSIQLLNSAGAHNS